jgi:hypothetical protein
MAAARKRRRYIYIAAILFGSIILAMVIILVVRLVNSRKDSTTSSPPASTISGLTSEQSKCLTDFTDSAPSAPLDYPTSCLPILQAVPANFTTADPHNADIIGAAKQFSALRLLFDGCSTGAQQGLSAGGWFKDTKTCVWAGVECGGSGRISTL